MLCYSERYISVCGIDPGTDTLGFTHGILDTDTGELTLNKAFTFKASKLVKQSDNIDAPLLHGQRQARLFLLFDLLQKEFEEVNPDVCMIEDFYVGKNVSTYGSLMAAQQMIMCSLHTCNPRAYCRLIKPAKGKQALGVKGNSGDKDEMIAGAKKALGIVDKNKLLDDIDEHTADAFGQLMAFVVSYRERHGITFK